MNVYRFYDACCERCGNWYGSTFQPPQTKNKKEAIAEMERNGWKEIKGKTICDKCNSR